MPKFYDEWACMRKGPVEKIRNKEYLVTQHWNNQTSGSIFLNYLNPLRLEEVVSWSNIWCGVMGRK